jgi:nucleoside phosphorylase
MFMGIAGSLDPNVRKGDVLVADYVRAYQYGRISDAGDFEPRAQFQEPTDLPLRTNAIAFAATTEWWEGLQRPDDADGWPLVHFGGLASGDLVIENAECTYFAPVRKHDPWLRAVDMESAGLALAVRHLRENGYVAGLMVIRGISDVPAGAMVAEASKIKDGANRETRKRWTDYASNAAAHFLEQFIRHAFPYAPEPESRPEQVDLSATKRQIDLATFASYQSRFIQAGELFTIHSINNETFQSTDRIHSRDLVASKPL